MAAYRSGALAGQPWHLKEMEEAEGDREDLADQEMCYFGLVVPALSSRFDKVGDIRAALEIVRFQSFSDNVTRIPHTMDAGEGKSPVIVMDWHGRPDDLICLAHEAAHALQIILSNHMMMPPLARETCAFLGELFLIEDARKHHSSLFGSLQRVWQAENEVYLATDLNSLSDALSNPETPYHYRQNYPIARLAAGELFRRGSGKWLHDLFASGRDGMKHLPISAMANLAGDIRNYLPPMPGPDADRPRMTAYRKLGARALLDIDYLEGPSERRIADYYADQLHHGRENTALVVLNDDRKPIGYATWFNSPEKNTVTLSRQAAPFGDHLVLQRKLEQHLQTEGAVDANHSRSARARQTAW